MRKQWLLSIVVIICLVLPSSNPINTLYDSPQLFDVAQSTEGLPRVYGVNYADAIYASVNITNYINLVREFSELGPRYIMTYADIAGSNNEEARFWLIDKMTALSNGRLQIEVNGTFKNVIARLPGYLPDEDNELPIFVVSAHYDTNAGSPGANKDGSGIAVLLELIRIMSNYEWPLDIIFIAFNGEHALGNLLGSKELSNYFQVHEIDILAMYNVDTILRQNTYAPPDERILLAYYQGGKYWAELAKTMGNYYGGDIIQIIPYNDASFWSSSSNYYFAERGFQNVLLAYESGYMYDSVSGTSNDVWTGGGLSYYIGRETTAFIGSSLAFAMGRAYGHQTKLFDIRIVREGVSSVFYIPISTPTTVNITCRWYGGGVNFILTNPNDYLLNSSIYTTGCPWEPFQVLSHTITTNGLYKLIIYNMGSDPVGVDVYIEFDSDIDNNDVNDSEEYWLDTDLFDIDTDSDTISDALEIIKGLDPENPDSDNDQMPDSYELQVGFNPLDENDALDDADNDTLSNVQEYLLGLNPFNADSDNDGMDDAWELTYDLNPLVNDADENPDGDRYTNIEEYLRDSNPQVAETEEIPILWIVTLIAAITLVIVGIFIYKRQ